mgnify:CR=1 FL=1
MENQEITFFKGTHRIIPPSKTIKNNESKIKTAGITRITEITHLDRIGIPVFSAIRPTAQDGGISIYGGKGITPEHAKASAMMEGFERYSAEKQDTDETVIAGLNEIEGKYTFVIKDFTQRPEILLLKRVNDIKYVLFQKPFVFNSNVGSAGSEELWSYMG